MSSFSEIPPIAPMSVRKQSTEDADTDFRRRTLSNRGCFLPRRYVMAFMFFVLLVIEDSKNLSIAFTLDYVITSEESSKVDYPSIGNWTEAELQNLGIFMQVGDIFANIIGALLIYEFSCHKFFLISVTASSILHMLTPTALNHHSIVFFLTVLIGQETFRVPMYTAILSMWKDWGPPSERASLVTFSLCGVVLEAFGVMFYILLFPYITKSICYYSGIGGIIWVLFWYNITADIPQNDPLISENEFLYLESNIPSNIQEKVKLKDVPWKSILKSVQLMILSSIFFKMACSVTTIQISGVFFSFHLGDNYNPLYIILPFVASFAAILLGSAILMDFLINKYRSHTLRIRKGFLCSGFLLQCILLLGTITSSQLTKAIFFVLAYSSFALSIPGCFTYPLDLSPRYVSIIAGIGFAFYSAGHLCFQYLIEQTFEWESLHSISWLFLFDGLLSLTVAVIFALWGNVEEQQWSLILSSYHRGSDYKRYPKPDDEDDVNLVLGTL